MLSVTPSVVTPGQDHLQLKPIATPINAALLPPLVQMGPLETYWRLVQ